MQEYAPKGQIPLGAYLCAADVLLCKNRIVDEKRSRKKKRKAHQGIFEKRQIAVGNYGEGNGGVCGKDQKEESYRLTKDGVYAVDQKPVGEGQNLHGKPTFYVYL